MSEGIYKLLEALGCTQFSEKEDTHGPKILCTCPMHEDSNPSFMIRPEAPNPFNCFSCGGGAGLVTLVMRSKSLKYKAAKRWAEKHIDLSKVELRKAFKSREKVALPVISEMVLAAYSEWSKPATDYWKKRGFTDATTRRHGVGFDRHANRIIIPIRNADDRLIGFVGRTILPKGKPRYLVYDDKPKEQMLLGIQHVNFNEPLMVVEGPADYLKARQHGQCNVVSLLGSHASPWQLEQLARAKKLLLFLDNDDAGADGAMDIIERLATHNILVPCYTDKDKDVGAMTKERFDLLISTVKPYYFKSLQAYD